MGAIVLVALFGPVPHAFLSLGEVASAPPALPSALGLDLGGDLELSLEGLGDFLGR